MPDFIKRLDILHEATFAQPAFELIREFGPVIKTFYKFLGERTSVSPAFTTINSTNNFGELVIRIGLFNNLASVELKAEKLSISLPNLTSVDDIQVGKDTLLLSHQALAAALPHISLNASNFTLSNWITLEGGMSAAETILSKCSTPAQPVEASAWGATTSRNGLRLITRNDSEGWSATIFGDPSLAPGSQLFLSVDFSFVRNGIKPINEQLQVGEEKLRQLLKALGVKLADD
jgi:hypothetical protein